MHREIHAVTSFLQSENKILILLRSDRVSTYPGKWAGVSGSIDDDKTADEQAIVEIEEETDLSGGQIELIKKGEPLLIDDEELGLRKMIHTYLFHVANRDAIKIDWEHTEIKWIKPEQIDNYETMPKLKETLAQVISW